MARTVNNRFKQLFWAFGSLVLSLIIGTIGYELLEGYGLVDSMYMSAMIISTVGFGEIRELSHSGKIFSIIYFMLNICLFAYVVAVFSKYLYGGELRDIFTKYMLGRQVGKLENHVIVCGMGRNGYRAVMELKKEDVPFVVIDTSFDVIKRAFGDDPKINYVIGDATDDRILKEAGIDRARAIVACIPIDSTNVFVTLTAREMNPKIKIIARSISNAAESKLKTAGADYVVNPDEIGGNYMAMMVQKPEIIEFLNLLIGEGEIKLNLEEYAFSDYKEEFKGKSIHEMGVKETCRVTFVCHKSKINGYIFNPSSHTVLKEGDFMIVLGTPEDVNSFKKKFTTRLAIR